MIKSLGAPRPHPGVRSAFTSYYLPVNVIGSTGTAAVSANIAYYALFNLAGAVVDRLGIEVTTGSAGAARLGIYTNNEGMPGTLILDGGTVDTTSIAVVEATISALTMPNDWVWMVSVFNATPTCRTGGVNNQSLTGIGNLNSGARGIQGAFTYGTLPATAPAPTAFSTGIPLMFMRKS